MAHFCRSGYANVTFGLRRIIVCRHPVPYSTVELLTGYSQVMTTPNNAELIWTTNYLPLRLDF